MPVSSFFPSIHRADRAGRTLRLLVLWLFLLSAPVLYAADDAYLAGYVASVLEREYRLHGAHVEVQDGVVVIRTESLSGIPEDKLKVALKEIPGVRRVEVLETVEAPVPAASGAAAAAAVQPPRSNWFPDDLLVVPFHADPRWPHFSAAVRRFQNDPNFSNMFAGNFGETFAFYRGPAPFGGQWDFSVQAGVFSLFDVSSVSGSNDLVNADYRFGLMTGYRMGRLSGFIRLYHQSSHLGDEFVLNSQVNRINLSYEELDLKLSFDAASWLRLYGGGGLLVRRDPGDMGIGTAQWGVELSSPWTLWGGHLRPVAYGDFQAHERTQWQVAHSLMAGLQLERVQIGHRKVQVLFEYFSGPSPDGQFFVQQAKWLGIGIHLYF